MILSSSALPSKRKPPSRRAAIPGNGVVASRSHLVVDVRALSPNCFAQRSISGMPIGVAPNWCFICSGSAATPWKRSSMTKTARPESAGPAPSTSVLNLHSPMRAASCMWLRQYLPAAWRRIDDHSSTFSRTVARSQYTSVPFSSSAPAPQCQKRCPLWRGFVKKAAGNNVIQHHRWATWKIGPGAKEICLLRPLVLAPPALKTICRSGSYGSCTNTEAMHRVASRWRRRASLRPCTASSWA